MSVTFALRALGLAALLAAASIAPGHAATPTGMPATAAQTAPETAPPAKHKHKKNKKSSVKYDRGSAESTAERDRRLTRECKGRPNAGACLGYAS